jgi:hypothetical protein
MSAAYIQNNFMKLILTLIFIPTVLDSFEHIVYIWLGYIKVEVEIIKQLLR